MTDKLDITLTVNGRDHAVRLEPRKTLVDAIRDDCGLTGTHIGCEHGVCGACTVILDGEAVRSCLMFAVQAQGKTIRTVESLAKGGALHPLQRAFMAHHGLQCGFCTPGFLMLAANTLERKPDIEEDELLDVLASNLCRCTGYQNIVKAVKAAQQEMSASSAAARSRESAKSEPQENSEPQTEPEPQGKSEQKAKSEQQAQPETNAEPEPQAQPEPRPEPTASEQTAPVSPPAKE